MIDVEVFVSALVTLLVIIDPPGCAPIFASLTPHASPAQRRAMAVRATLVAAGILLFFAVLGGTLSSAFVAFGFARLRFPGRDLLFLILLGTMMIPFHVTLIPTFVLYKFLKWLDTFKPFTVVPSAIARATNALVRDSWRRSDTLSAGQPRWQSRSKL